MSPSLSFGAEARALERRTAPLLRFGRPGLRKALTAWLAMYDRWHTTFTAELAAVDGALQQALTPAQRTAGEELRAELQGGLSRIANLQAADRELLRLAGGKAAPDA